MSHDLIVINLAEVDPEWRRDLLTLPQLYRGELSGSDLRHLAHLADERKERDEERLLEVLYGVAS